MKPEEEQATTEWPELTQKIESAPSVLSAVKGLSVPLLLAVLAMAALWPSLGNGFVNLDDPAYVSANAQVRQGLSWRGVVWAFTTLDRGFWHPLTWLSLMLDAQLFGSHASGYHLTSLLLHAANAALVFILLRRLTGRTWRSFFVAALFAVHPLHVESVAWVSERKDVLSTFFLLLALWAYVRYAGENPPGKRWVTAGRRGSVPEVGPGAIVRGSHWFYWLSLAFFLLALMSKAMVVSFPLLLLLIDFWPVQRVPESTALNGGVHESKEGFPTKEEYGTDIPRGREAVIPALREKAPFFLLALVVGVVTLVAQKRLGALAAGSKFPLVERLANAVVSYGHYLWQTVCPIDLAPFYPFPSHVSFVLAGAVGLLLVLISGVAILLACARPYLLFGWAWYGITLLPVSGLVQVGGQAHADRYTYVPLIGIFIMLIWWAYDSSLSFERKAERPAAVSERPPSLRPSEIRTRFSGYNPWLAPVAGGLLIMACTGLSWHQARYWRNSEVLFRHTLAVTSNNELAENNLGAALSAQGRLPEAITHLQRAVRLKPDHALAQGNLGVALVSEGKLAEAIGPLETAVRLMPNYPVAQGNLGGALLGRGRLDEAVAHLQAAVLLSPDYAEAQRNLGIALGSKGRLDESIQHLKIAAKLAPADAEVHYNLAVALAGARRVDEAIAEYEKVVKLAPNHAEAHNNLGAMLGAKGKLKEAIVEFREAVMLKPEYKAAQNNLRAALAAYRK